MNPTNPQPFDNNSFNSNSPSPIPQQPRSGPPVMRSFAPDPFENPPPASNQKGLVIAAVALGIGLTVVGIGFAFGGRSSASTTVPVAAATPTIFDEQRQMMREAMDMAKEAREAQREHMDRMRQAMERENDDSHFQQDSFRRN